MLRISTHHRKLPITSWTVVTTSIGTIVTPLIATPSIEGELLRNHYGLGNSTASTRSNVASDLHGIMLCDRRLSTLPSYLFIFDLIPTLNFLIVASSLIRNLF